MENFDNPDEHQEKPDQSERSKENDNPSTEVEELTQVDQPLPAGNPLAPETPAKIVDAADELRKNTVQEFQKIIDRARERADMPAVDWKPGFAEREQPDLSGITAVLQKVVENRGFGELGQLVGLENHLKTADRLTDKYLREAPTDSISEFAGKVNDMVRYTAAIPEGAYSRNTTAILSELGARGYTNEAGQRIDPSDTNAVKNFWLDDNRYKGINVTMRAPRLAGEDKGQLFELQFHTPDSYTTKTETHLPYEIYQSTTSTYAQKIDAITVLVEQSAKLPENPPGAENIGRIIDTRYDTWLKKNMGDVLEDFRKNDWEWKSPVLDWDNWVKAQLERERTAEIRRGHE